MLPHEPSRFGIGAIGMMSLRVHRGLMGLKAYFNVYLSDDRSELVILVDSPLPVQPW